MKLLRIIAAAALLALAGAPAVNASAAGPKKTVSSADFRGKFSATVMQGAQAGTTYGGTLALHGYKSGRLTGNLTLDGSGRRVRVTGQLHGSLIGITMQLGGGQTVSGTGNVAYDPDTKQNTIGGTFAGPTEPSFGVWGYYVPSTEQGGCLIGVPVRRPGICYVVD